MSITNMLNTGTSFPTTPGALGTVLTMTGATSTGWMAGGGSGFAYAAALWVDQINGDDGNAGTSIDTPLLTVQAAINLALQNPTVIYVVDVGFSNTETLVTLGVGPGLGQHLFIVAPATLFSGSFTTGAYDTLINIQAAALANVTNNGNGTGSFYYSAAAFGISGFTDNGSCTVVSEGAITGYNQASNGNASNVRCSHLQGTGTMTGSINALASFAIDTLTMDGSAGPGASYLMAPIINGISLINGTSANVYMACNQSSSITNDGSWLINNVLGSTNATGFANSAIISGTLTLGTALTTGNYYALPDVDATVPGQLLSSNAFGAVTWQSAPGAFNYPGIYVSQSLGNDANTGLYDSPVATISHALAIASPNTIIYVIGSDTYNENLSISLNIIILAPDAVLNAASGDAITVTGNYVVHFEFDQIYTSSSSTNVLNMVMNGNCYFQVNNVLIGNIITNSGNVQISIKAVLGSSFAPVQLTADGGQIFGSIFEAVSGLIFTPISTGIVQVTVNINDALGGITPTLNQYFILSSPIVNPDPASNLIYVDPNVDYSNLTGGGSVILHAGITGVYFQEYKIRNIFTTIGTNFAAGDRDLQITDESGNVYTVIPSAALLALANSEWGSINVPFPVSIALNTNTGGGDNILATYVNGTTDYTSGNFNIVLELQRVL